MKETKMSVWMGGNVCMCVTERTRGRKSGDGVDTGGNMEGQLYDPEVT